MAKKISATDARQRIEPGWTRLNELLAEIPADRVDLPGVNSDWSIKIMLGHIAFWERNAARVIQVMAEEQALPPIDFNVINKQVAEADTDRTYDDLCKDFDTAHEELLAVIDHTGEVDSTRLSWDTWDHYPEHIKQLEEWRQKIGI